MTLLRSRTVPFLDLSAMNAEVSDLVGVQWNDLMVENAYIGGEWVERFESSWASYCGATYAVGVANGTDALELTLRALGIGTGDEVILPANTFVATAAAVHLAGAHPRFADVDPDTALLTADGVRSMLGPRTAAVIVTHLFGNMANMEELVRVSDANHLALIEDAAQAHGATWEGAKAGSLSVAGCFSFYPGKNLGAFGDAGAVVTSDQRLAEGIRSLGNHGRSPRSKHAHGLIGRNSRMDALQAAVLSAKLPRLDTWNHSRRQAARIYRERLPATAGAWIAEEDRSQSAYHLNVLRVRSRDDVISHLQRSSIETGVHYPVPCHLQPGYERYRSERLPAAERLANEILSLPIYPHITVDTIDYVCEALLEWTDHANHPSHHGA